MWFGHAVAVGEALLLGQRAGIEAEALRALLADSAAASRFLDRDAPALLSGDYLESFGLDRCCEELDAVVATAADVQLPLQLGRAVRDSYARALARFGPRAGELLAVALLEEQAGTLLRRAPVARCSSRPAG
jgi:3-hydroxyisobutyrate dehydrogenase